MWLLQILVASNLLSLFKVSAQDACPVQCSCTEETNDDGVAYTVRCGELKLPKVPNLSSLLEVKLPIYLSFDDNEITSVSGGDFPSGLNVVSLNLDENVELEISSDAFANLTTTLKILTLELVGLKFDGPLTFLRSLGGLEELSLSHNSKGSGNIQVALFEETWPVVKTLKTLRMSYCGISSISEESLKSLVSLRHLELTNNKFTKVPSAVRHLKELRQLSLSRCKLETLEDDTFLGTARLKVLKLDSNNLQIIEPNAFRGLEKSLVRLILQKCRLQQIPSQAIKNLEVVEYIDLSQNNFITAPSSSFIGKYCLKDLLISGVGLQFEPHTFSGQKNCIVNLSIRQMNLQTVPREALSELDKLSNLNLEYNMITELPKNSLTGIKATSISLAHNPLRNIDPGGLSGLPPNVYINMQKTEMTDIDFLLHYSPGTIGAVNLDFAKLVCQCSLKSVLDAVQYVRVSGSCRNGTEDIPVSSGVLNHIFHDMCKEEEPTNFGSMIKKNVYIFLFPLVLSGRNV